MENAALRADYRIVVPPGYVRQLALWFCADKDYYRLEVRELGRPDLAMALLDSGLLTVSDLSIRGVGLDLSLPFAEAEKFQQGGTLFLFLKLWDPLAEDPSSLLSVFTFCRLMRVESKETHLSLGLRFERFAQGSKNEKALEFRDARRCGVSDLTRWCDNLARGAFRQAELASKGLDLDNLLAEVEAIAKGTEATDNMREDK